MRSWDQSSGARISDFHFLDRVLGSAGLDYSLRHEIHKRIMLFFEVEAVFFLFDQVSPVIFETSGRF